MSRCQEWVTCFFFVSGSARASSSGRSVTCLGLKRGRKGGSERGGAICCCCCCRRRCCCLKSWLKHPLPGCLWERGRARVSPSADFADSRWHLGFGDTSASLCQPCHSLSRFCRGRCHPGSRTRLCLPSAGSARAAPAPGRAEAAEQPQPGRSRRRPARQRGGLPWAPASFLLPHTHTRCCPPFRRQLQSFLRPRRWDVLCTVFLTRRHVSHLQDEGRQGYGWRRGC